MTQGATAFDGTLLIIREKPDRSFGKRRRVQMLPAQTEPGRAIAVGQEPKVADLDEARWQDVEQEARMNSVALRVMVLMRCDP